MNEVFEDYEKGIMLRTLKLNFRGEWEFDVSSMKTRKKIMLITRALIQSYEAGGAKLLYNEVIHALPAQAIVSKDKLEEAKEKHALKNWNMVLGLKNPDGELVMEERDGKLLIYEHVLYEQFEIVMNIDKLTPEARVQIDKDAREGVMLRAMEKSGRGEWEFDLSHLSTHEKCVFLIECMHIAYDHPSSPIKRNYWRYKRERPRFPYTMGEEFEARIKKEWAEERWNNMLNFKNSEGEIVMKEHDNGKLSIYDEVLKESLEHGLSLEEAKKKAEEAAK